MTQITPNPATTHDLRFRLIEILAPHAGLKVVEIAAQAETFILGPLFKFDPQTESMDSVIAASMPAPPPVKAAPRPVKASPDKASGEAETVAAMREMISLGKRISGNALGKILGCSQVTASRRLAALESRGIARREGINTNLRYFLVEDATPESPPASDPVRMANGTSPIVWTEDRKARLKDMVAEGSHIEFMASDLGLAANQVADQIKRLCLTATWIEAKAGKDGTPPSALKLALAREPLPEDRLRHIAEPEPAAPATMDFVADYLRGCGQDVDMSGTGAWTLEGCAIPPRRLLAAANQYRVANSLPPFSVRGL